MMQGQTSQNQPSQHQWLFGMLCNRCIQGHGRFAEVILEFTSAHVEDQVQNKIMLDRLSGANLDTAGKNLERAAVELFLQGCKFHWVRTEIGDESSPWGRLCCIEKD